MPLAYAGAVLFPLAAVGTLARRPRGRGIFLGFSLAGLAYGASTPILLDATSRLPGFSLALNYRLVFLAPLGLAGLAALGADRLVGRRSALPALAIAAAAVVALLSVFFALSRGVFRERELPTDFVALSFAAEALPVLLLGLAALSGRKRERHVVTAAVVLLVAQRYLEMRGVYPTLPSRSLAPAMPTIAALPDAGDPYRVVAVGEDFRPNGAALFGREDVRGYESLVLRRFEETYPLWCRRQFASHNRVDDVGAPFLSFLNARYAVGEPGAPAPPGWTVIARGREATLFENPRALPRAFVPRRVKYQPDPKRRLAEMAEASNFEEEAWLNEPPLTPSLSPQAGRGNTHLTVREIGTDLIIEADVRERALVATSIPDWPGWRAEASGRNLELVTVNHAFIGFWLPPGRHSVRLRYLPQTFVVGGVLAGLSFAAAVLVPLFRRRRASHPAALR